MFPVDPNKQGEADYYKIEGANTSVPSSVPDSVAFVGAGKSDPPPVSAESRETTTSLGDEHGATELPLAAKQGSEEPAATEPTADDVTPTEPVTDDVTSAATVVADPVEASAPDETPAA